MTLLPVKNLERSYNLRRQSTTLRIDLVSLQAVTSFSVDGYSTGKTLDSLWMFSTDFSGEGDGSLLLTDWLFAVLLGLLFSVTSGLTDRQRV